MPRELTPKQRRFIAAYQTGVTAAQAAIEAGYSPHSAKHIAYSLMHDNKLVRVELDKLAQQLVASAEYNGEKCMAELDDAIAFAKQHKQANAVVKAVELRARLAGLLRDKLDITVERVDLAGALEEARSRVPRPSCDLEPPIVGEFKQLSGSAARGAVDRQSISPPSPSVSPGTPRRSANSPGNGSHPARGGGGGGRGTPKTGAQVSSGAS